MNESLSVKDCNSVTLHSWDQRTAPEMFWLSVVSLLCFAGLLHLHGKPEYQPIWVACGLGLAGIYPACWLDAIYGGRHGTAQGRMRWLSIILPPLRLAAGDHATGQSVWLPGLGWHLKGPVLEQKLDRRASLPMVLMALMVLPLMALDKFYEAHLAADPWLSGLLNGAHGMIWFAFAGEFILRVSITTKKWSYVKEHWIDVAIVLLPLIPFLQALRVGRLARLQTLTSSAGKLYRLRGVSLRAWRALLLIDAVKRILYGPPALRLARLRAVVNQKELELLNLRTEVARLAAAFPVQTDFLNTDLGPRREDDRSASKAA